MELLLLGTAAAEGWPAPFCACPNCEGARQRGGANLRARSGALLDDDFKIDYSADSALHMQGCRRSLASVRTLAFSHQHVDHIQPSELRWLAPPFTQTPPQEPIEVFGNEQVMALLQQELTLVPKTAPYLDLHQLKEFESVTTRDGDEILPLPADHVAGALLLRITRGGKTLFYGHDSGLFPAATLDALGDGPPLDILLLDCTSGGQKTSNRGHMDIFGIAQMSEELRRRDVVTDATRVIATHFSHNGGLLHEELVKALLPHGIEVAFDGMIVRV